MHDGIAIIDSSDDIPCHLYASFVVTQARRDTTVRRSARTNINLGASIWFLKKNKIDSPSQFTLYREALKI